MHLLQELDLQLRKPKSSVIEAPCKILQLKKALHETPNPGDTVCRVFFKSNTLFVLLTLQIKYQGQANHDKTFENS